MGPLASLLLANLGDGARELAGAPALEDTLRAHLAAGRAAWPSLSVADPAFIEHLARRLAEENQPAQALADLHAADLFLACACSQLDGRALAELDRLLVRVVPVALARLSVTRSFVDDVCQLLREKLLVDRRIADYSGRGPLEMWLRVSAVRTAISLCRRGKREIPSDDEELADLEAVAPDPELAALKGEHLDAFKSAFRDALASLSARERTLLRQHFLDGLSIDQLGALYRVHRATAARWIVRARRDILDETRRLLVERLQLSVGEFESVMRLVRSHVQVSLDRILGDPGS